MDLGERDVERFEEQGFLVLPRFLDAAAIERLRHEIDELPIRMRGGAPAGVEVLWEPVTAPGGPRIKQLLHAEQVCPEIAAFVASTPMLDLLEPLLGPGIDLYEVKVLGKAERVGGPVPWHQDFPYWRERVREPLLVCCMIYLDDADLSNGCLELVPGSHRHGVLDHRFHGGDDFNRRLERAPPGAVEAIAAPAGTAILFTPLTVHASRPNPSGRSRRAFTAVFTPSGNGESRGVLRGAEDDATVAAAFALERVPRFTGRGPHGGQCAAHYRRRELWKYALESVEDRGRPWVQVGCGDDGSFEWLAARKPPGTRLVRVDPLAPDATPRAEVECVASIAAALERLGSEERLGWLEIGSRFHASTRCDLRTLGAALGPGTILVMDRFHGFGGWTVQAARALLEHLSAEELRVEVLAQADESIAARVLGRGAFAITAARAAMPRSAAEGIAFGVGPENVDPVRGRSAAIRSSARRFAERCRREARRRLSRDYSLFPELEIPKIEGDGERNALCRTHQRRAGLWRLAIAAVDDPSLPWAEFGVGEGESLDWFAAHKPARTMLYGFDGFEGIPEPWLDLPAGHWRTAPYESHRPDVTIVAGPFEETLARPDVLDRLTPRIGLLHVDCDLRSSTRTILERLADRIGAGTVLVFDELYGYPGWARHEARALFEFCRSRAIELEYLARADAQVAVRIAGVGGGPRASVRRVADRKPGPGLRLVLEPSLASWLVARLRRIAGGARARAQAAFFGGASSSAGRADGARSPRRHARRRFFT